MSREPRGELGSVCDLAFAVKGGEGVEGADQDGEVEDGEREVGPE